MKQPLLTLLFVHVLFTCAVAQWEPAENTMLTPWGEKINPENAWQEYPRPQMMRDEWMSLNGLWEYAITSNLAEKPEEWHANILVPFALETPLSGVGKRLKSDEVIWYRRSFEWKPTSGERQLLNFEGVDYKCRVWVNNKLAGSHVGGNLPFSFDITEFVKEGQNELVLRVIDGTDDPDLYQLRGKQKRNNKGIWYTPSSGIWAPVWMETVPKTFIQSIKVLADMHGELKVASRIGGLLQDVQLKVTVLDSGRIVAERIGMDNNLEMHIKNVKQWSPSFPFLYDLKIELITSDGKVLDKITSYTGFRTVGKESDTNGNWQFTLNGKKIFHFGPLDQGWWPGSFLLPPSDKAIVWEMDVLKKAGFNMIRKHKKVEPRRYYYHADRLGFVIWQDQTSGGSGGSEWPKWKKLRADLEGYEPKNPRWWSSEDDPLNADWPDWAH
ncbi:MAG: sugar-binding domain-containing protein [Bacteroidota bacterium]